MKAAARRLARSPGFSAAVIGTVALAVGANTAVFSIVNGLLLRSLPVREPHRLATISSEFAVSRGFSAGLGWNHATWERFREGADVFAAACVWSPMRGNVAQGGGEVQPVSILVGSGDFFETLGVSPQLGRVFTLADDAPGGGPDGPVAVITHRLWTNRFGGDERAVGARLVIEGAPFTIVGVTPPGFTGIEIGRPADVIIPLETDGLLHPTGVSRFGSTSYLLIVLLRLKAGQSLDSATAAARTLQRHLLAANAKTPKFLEDPFVVVPAATGVSGYGAGVPGLRQQYSQALRILVGLAGVVLLVACIDIANLLLSRGRAKQFELSVRAALGSTAGGLIRHTLAEGVVLASIGAALGLPVGVWTARALVAAMSTGSSPIQLDLSPDWHVVTFALAATAVTLLLFSAGPAWRAARVDPGQSLKPADSGTRGGPGHARISLTDGLLAGQVALSFVLVVSAALLGATFAQLSEVPLGFDADRILIVGVDTAQAHRDAATRNAYYHRLVEAVGMVPGVARAAGSAMTPLSPQTRSAIYSEPGHVPGHIVSPGWFDAYGLSLKEGRDFTASDRSGTPRVVIVNEAYARQYFDARPALAETVDNRTVVGVVSNAVFGSPREGMRPTIYEPMAQAGTMGPPDRTSVWINVRAAAGPPSALAPAIAAALRNLHPALTFTFRPLPADVAATLAAERALALLAGCFAVLALVLATVGLYGTTAHAVERRRREIGIRVALGAQPAQAVRLMLVRNLIVAGAGLALGAIAAASVTRALASQLFGVRPLDATTFAAVMLVLFGVSALAAWIPARRAARVDPLIALRQH